MGAKKSVPDHSETGQGEECASGTLDRRKDYNKSQVEKSSVIEQSFSKNSIVSNTHVVFGNKCGHNRLFPLKFIAPDHHKPRPSFLQSVVKKLKLDYFARKLLKSLSKDRRKRSERMDMIILVLETFLQYTDLSSFRVGIIWEDKYKLMPIQPLKQDRIRGIDSFSLMREINRGRDSRSEIPLRRVLRALKDIYSAGYMDVAAKSKVGENGFIYGLTAIRQFKLKFFRELGFSREHLNYVQKQKVKTMYKEQLRRRDKLTSANDFISSFKDDDKLQKNQLEIPVLSGRDIIDAKIAASVENFDELKKAFPDKSVAEFAMELARRRMPP